MAEAFAILQCTQLTPAATTKRAPWTRTEKDLTIAHCGAVRLRPPLLFHLSGMRLRVWTAPSFVEGARDFACCSEFDSSLISDVIHVQHGTRKVIIFFFTSSHFFVVFARWYQRSHVLD